MSDWIEDVERLIRERGEALGVNAIAQALEVPVATMQKRLEKSKFVKTPQRKWDIPENAVLSTSNQEAYANALDSHISAIKAYTDILVNTLDTATTLISTQRVLAPSVAEVSSLGTNNTPKLDKRLEDVIENIRLLPKMIKEHINKFPEEYHALLGNMDYMDAFIQIGRVGLNTLMNELNEIILEDREFLSDEALTMLKRYQKSK